MRKSSRLLRICAKSFPTLNNDYRMNPFHNAPKASSGGGVEPAGEEEDNSSPETAL